MREKEEEMLDKNDQILISTLKSRISRVLSVKTKLLKVEKNVLEGIYSIIDKLITGDEEYNDMEIFRDHLSNSLSLIENSKKVYIKDHIIPLISKMANRNWGEPKDE